MEELHLSISNFLAIALKPFVEEEHLRAECIRVASPIYVSAVTNLTPPPRLSAAVYCRPGCSRLADFGRRPRAETVGRSGSMSTHIVLEEPKIVPVRKRPAKRRAERCAEASRRLGAHVQVRLLAGHVDPPPGWLLGASHRRLHPPGLHGAIRAAGQPHSLRLSWRSLRPPHRRQGQRPASQAAEVIQGGCQ